MSAVRQLVFSAAVALPLVAGACSSGGGGAPVGFGESGGASGSGGSGLPPELENCPFELWTDRGYCLPAREGARLIAVGDLFTVDWIEFDEHDNLYLGGQTRNINRSTGTDRINFDPEGPGHWLETTGTGDYFLTKRDPSGKQLWTRTFRVGVGDGDFGHAARMPDGGVVYGSFGPSLTLDSGTTIASSYAAFLLRFGPNGEDAGHLTLEADAGGSVRIYGVAVSSGGEIAYAGDHNGSVDLNPGAGTDVRGEQAMFVSWLADNGEYRTSREFAGSAEPHFMRFRGDRLLIAGAYGGEGSFFGPTSDAVGRSDEFLMTLDAAGAPLWVKTWPNTRIERHAVTNSGDILIFKSWNSADYEFAKLGAADGEPIWTLPARAWSVADVAAGAGRLVLLGRWAELGVDFDPGDGQDSSLTTSTGPFITAMDEDAKYLFTRADIRSFVYVLAIDARGKIHVARIDSAHIGPDPSVPPEDQNDLNLFIETFTVVSD